VKVGGTKGVVRGGGGVTKGEEGGKEKEVSRLTFFFQGSGSQGPSQHRPRRGLPRGGSQEGGRATREARED
jgi:hypothetical protein